MEQVLLEAISRGDVEIIYTIWRIGSLEKEGKVIGILTNYWEEILNNTKHLLCKKEPKNIQELMDAYDGQNLLSVLKNTLETLEKTFLCNLLETSRRSRILMLHLLSKEDFLPISIRKHLRFDIAYVHLDLINKKDYDKAQLLQHILLQSLNVEKVSPELLQDLLFKYKYEFLQNLVTFALCDLPKFQDTLRHLIHIFSQSEESKILYAPWSELARFIKNKPEFTPVITEIFLNEISPFEALKKTFDGLEILVQAMKNKYMDWLTRPEISKGSEKEWKMLLHSIIDHLTPADVRYIKKLPIHPELKEKIKKEYSLLQELERDGFPPFLCENALSDVLDETKMNVEFHHDEDHFELD